MTPYPNTLWYHVQDSLETLAHEPIVGAVPYMLARPMPIETAPRDGTRFLGARNGGWEIYWWSEHHRLWFPRAPMKWLPLPPAPEEA